MIRASSKFYIFNMFKTALLLVLSLAHAFEVFPETNIIALHLKASYGITADNVIVDLSKDE